MISLNALLHHIHLPLVPSDTQITGITLDSRKIQQGYLFAALPGAKSNGCDYIDVAIEKGASAILLPTNASFPETNQCIAIHCDNPRYVLALMTAIFFPNHPQHQVAITGTNGKTSTADFIRQIWQLQNLKAATIGTLGVISNTNYNYTGPVLTTPDSIMLHEILTNLVEHNVQHLALEASSHGLDQYRLDGLTIEAAGFTNLTRDHLDYHHDFQHYLEAKLRLFKNILPIGGVAGVNADMDPDALIKIKQAILDRKQNLRLVGEQGQFLQLLSVTPLPEGQKLEIKTALNDVFSVTIPLLGRYQVDNILLAVALIAKNEQDIANLIPLLPHLKGVRGRMEQAAILPNGAAIYVDYAHTPDALAHLLQSLRPHTDNDLYVIFGAGGDRDAGKRPLMAQEASKYADCVIITDDNPRTEDPDHIRKEVKAGAPAALEIADREEAIAQTIKKLQSGDILVVAGKGHEQGQIIGSVVHPFDDVTIIRKHVSSL
ncbi:UDP-N-acetylmuramyl tripeptide synthase (MurE) (PDB:1E8C) [Commensalibacter communis]|uniref:UDP-N-acetylmuramoyl-L-alanyl-D-glutamate--2,6-diaminopimelate ligase n=1 Tax=Commensalibacter communis TaxID=2972786 RepID=A0A9W4TM50_9PROT|nr:UDP-N-acetylmuramoyl-L-alanyl-D-glutamate--2,6-diaminopimelate ligase [Commensalibacter communis]CAI3922277.1 UDP-N-acetylmuramyl tripeptide synthase (MurE) (PDB:1E8C) [Commensalibacter communis]CAI3923443.1 UDP-N-acetylmuramyl tripeptide synthase (MurE) (PDB:1E8C) [Commensalibacter communis]CAI3939044.1 UDP-N-acetylmuramyl tripeptide synthase (MurE) (PDB:1E8C) [Commensalibacter communis]CAI3939616.1 UDP-N-acetylmuramyl tripeptide synthase (MurE) (PDB:1E8C) [Commensalibacter communis]